jgi:hypothetical protein
LTDHEAGAVVGRGRRLETQQDPKEEANVRAAVVVCLSAIVATLCASWFVGLPPRRQSGFRECTRLFFKACFAVANLAWSVGSNESRVESLTNREAYLAVWFVAFLPMLFVAAYATRLWLS